MVLHYHHRYHFVNTRPDGFRATQSRGTVKVTCAANEFAASAPQTFSASSEPPGCAVCGFLISFYKDENRGTISLHILDKSRG
jgi:hypothetical protein